MTLKPPSRDAWAWTRNPKAAGAATIAALLVSGMLIGLELALGRADRGLELEALPGFYAVIGLAGGALALAFGIGLRALLARADDAAHGPDHLESGGHDSQP
jgi:hypothetical protein